MRFFSRFFLILVFAFTFSCDLFAHCDTLDGPVVKDARAALEKKDVTPVLKWVEEEHEDGIRRAFDKALAASNAGPDAREKSEMEFFEVLVRVHREGEGAPFTGIKPEGTALDPVIVAADNALQKGSIEVLKTEMTETVSHGIQERFDRVREAQRHKDENILAGRAFVKAYVDFVHYIEQLSQVAEEVSEHHKHDEKKEKS